jgi:murein DD-endopeptidase MepM/ murein hydrolase activator NlpD
MAVIGWAVIGYFPRKAVPPEPSPVPSRLASALDMYPESGTPMPGPAASAEPDDSQAASIGSSSEETPSEPFYETVVRLEKGDTFGSVLHDLGLASDEIADAISALASQVSMKRLPVGQAMTLQIRTPDEAEAKPVLQTLTIRPEARREITLERDDEGGYGVEEKIFEVVSKLGRAEAMVDGSVIASAEAAGVPRPALAEMLRAFSWDVNFQHDIKEGDRFAVLIEQSWTSDGVPVDPGRLLWAELTTEGGEHIYSIYRFKPRRGADFFYNSDGQSVIKALLRTPLNMSRISSRFGMRRHPVLKFTRLHAGVDFAAPPGTPILAAGAGRVVEAGRKGGYGKWVKIRHSGDLATGYAHMSRIASGIRRSARVRQGQVIGFVGSSGLATGPHLHFELHRNGRPVNPLSVARRTLRASLAGEDLARFKEHVVQVDRWRESAAVIGSQ